MNLKTGVFSSMTLAALLALVSTPGVGAEPEKKAAEVEKSEAELERKLAEARKRLDAAAQDVAELSMSLSQNVMPHLERRFEIMDSNRAMLGIGLGARRGSEPDEGVEIVSVSPGGAAEKAGLKAGDVLLEVNGQALKRAGDKSARQKLIDTMRDVKPGEKVPVSYRRDGKVAKVTLTTQSLKRAFTMAVPHIKAMPNLGHFRFGSFGSAHALFGSAEIVPLTPKLGQYFGTETGLLVVRAPDDNRLKLEDGDVIIDIDGRKPSSPSHAMRILTSYQGGEKLTLNILRARKPMSVQVTVPETPEEGFEHSIEKRLKGVDGKFERRVIYAPTHATPGFPVAPPEAGVIAIPAVPASQPAPLVIPAPPLPDEPV